MCVISAIIVFNCFSNDNVFLWSSDPLPKQYLSLQDLFVKTVTCILLHTPEVKGQVFGPLILIFH